MFLASILCEDGKRWEQTLGYKFLDNSIPDQEYFTRILISKLV